MDGDRHWLLMGNQIVVLLNDGTASVIATVEDERAVRQMLRYTQLAQDVEFVGDQMAAMAKNHAEGGLEILLLVLGCVMDTQGQVGEVPCPELQPRE